MQNNALKTIWLALVAVAVTLSVLWYDNRSVVAPELTWQDVEIEAKRGNYRLIRTDDLARRLLEDKKPIQLVDTRQVWEYNSGYIKGARNFPMEPTAWSRWRSKGALERFLGPDKEQSIVFY